MPMKLMLTSSPHILHRDSTQGIMWWVIIALLFPSAAGVYFFGLSALWLILFSALVSVISEAVFQKVTRQPITINDGSAIITGILLALILPPGFPLWMAGVGAAVAIILVKQLFGGLGYNVFNPALAARAVLLASWPVAMTSWLKPFDAITTATPLYLAKTGQALPAYFQLFLGNRAGCLGETSVLAILIGAGILFYKKIIDWSIPTAYIGTVALLTFFLGYDPIFYTISGGLMLGAFFMATDYVTSPITIKGRLIFGVGCGVFTVLIRFFGGFPEGVNYSILLMNILTPMIDKYAIPRVYGKSKKNGKNS